MNRFNMNIENRATEFFGCTVFWYYKNLLESTLKNQTKNFFERDSRKGRQIPMTISAMPRSTKPIMG